LGWINKEMFNTRQEFTEFHDCVYSSNTSNDVERYVIPIHAVPTTDQNLKRLYSLHTHFNPLTDTLKTVGSDFDHLPEKHAIGLMTNSNLVEHYCIEAKNSKRISLYLADSERFVLTSTPQLIEPNVSVSSPVYALVSTNLIIDLARVSNTKSIEHNQHFLSTVGSQSFNVPFYDRNLEKGHVLWIDPFDIPVSGLRYCSSKTERELLHRDPYKKIGRIRYICKWDDLRETDDWIHSLFSMFTENEDFLSTSLNECIPFHKPFSVKFEVVSDIGPQIPLRKLRYTSQCETIQQLLFEIYDTMCKIKNVTEIESGILVIYRENGNISKVGSDMRGIVINGPHFDHCIVLHPSLNSFSIVSSNENIDNLKHFALSQTLAFSNASIQLYTSATLDMCILRNHVWGFIQSSGHIMLASSIGMVRQVTYQNSCYAIHPFMSCTKRPRKFGNNIPVWKLGSGMFLTPYYHSGYLMVTEVDHQVQLQLGPIPVVSEATITFLEFIHSNYNQVKHKFQKIEQFIRMLKRSNAIDFFTSFYVNQNRDVSLSEVATDIKEVAENSKHIKCFLEKQKSSRQLQKTCCLC
jgi:hypothetical protein